jgi:hypothetical protein
MILLGIILLIIGIFVARHILWPVAGVLLLIGVILWVASAPVCGGPYGCY